MPRPPSGPAVVAPGSPAHRGGARKGRVRDRHDPKRIRYGCFLPDLTGLATAPPTPAPRGGYIRSRVARHKGIAGKNDRPILPAISIAYRAASVFPSQPCRRLASRRRGRSLPDPRTGIVVVTDQTKTDDAAQFLFGWQEQGGPRVVPPTQMGFGSTVLEQAARDFAREVRIDYRPEGLFYQFEVDLTAVNGRSSEAPREAG